MYDEQLVMFAEWDSATLMRSAERWWFRSAEEPAIRKYVLELLGKRDVYIYKQLVRRILHDPWSALPSWVQHDVAMILLDRKWIQPIAIYSS